jgi:hypothetical protein
MRIRCSSMGLAPDCLSGLCNPPSVLRLPLITQYGLPNTTHSRTHATPLTGYRQFLFGATPLSLASLLSAWWLLGSVLDYTPLSNRHQPIVALNVWLFARQGKSDIRSMTSPTVCAVEVPMKGKI